MKLLTVVGMNIIVVWFLTVIPLLIAQVKASCTLKVSPFASHYSTIRCMDFGVGGILIIVREAQAYCPLDQVQLLLVQP
jgi:hypothetical protein